MTVVPPPAVILRYVQRILRPGETLQERIVSGTLWMTIFNVVDRIVRIGTVIVLAWFLSPADFGLFGLGLLTLTALKKGSKLGISTALIQFESDDVDDYLDTAWVLRAIRGVVIAVVALLSAPFVASFFDAPRLTTVVRVLALSPLLAGLRNPGVVYFRKNLTFDKQFVYQISGTVAYTCVALIVAFVSSNVWALVLGTLAVATIQTVVSYGVHSYRPRFAYDAQAARELLNFGKWIFGSGLVLLALNWGDDAFIGWYLGAASLGLYRLAFNFSNAPTTEVTNVVTSVVFPAFSQIQDDIAALRQAFFRTIRFVSYVSFPMSVGIIVVAPVFVRAFFDPEWLPMIDVIRVLAIWGALRSIVAIIGPLFEAVGSPEYNTALQLLRLVFFGAAIYPATMAWGTTGTAIALVLSAIPENPISLYLAVKEVNGSVRSVLRSFLVPLTASLFMGGMVLFAEQIIPALPKSIEFGLLVLVGVSVYIAALLFGTLVLDIKLKQDIVSLRTALE